MLTEEQAKQLDLVPYVPEGYTWEDIGLHKIEISRPSPFASDKLFAKILGKKPRVSKRKLDIHGSYIYPLIDGKRTIRELADLMGQEFGEEVEPLYERFIEYCGMLWRNELIEIVGQPHHPEKK